MGGNAPRPLVRLKKKVLPRPAIESQNPPKVTCGNRDSAVPILGAPSPCCQAPLPPLAHFPGAGVSAKNSFRVPDRKCLGDRRIFSATEKKISGQDRQERTPRQARQCVLKCQNGRVRYRGTIGPAAVCAKRAQRAGRLDTFPVSSTTAPPIAPHFPSTFRVFLMVHQASFAPPQSRHWVRAVRK